MTATSLDLTPGAVLDRAADIIEAQGLARGDYYWPDGQTAPSGCPVCTLGAIAVACGLDPAVWHDDVPAHDLRPAQDAVLRLIDHLGLDPQKDPDDLWDESIGGWNDNASLAEIVAELRAAAKDGA